MEIDHPLVTESITSAIEATIVDVSKVRYTSAKEKRKHANFTLIRVNVHWFVPVEPSGHILVPRVDKMAELDSVIDPAPEWL